MLRVAFVQPDGTRREVSAPVGITLMEAARQHGVAGVVAQCGGACACATCHVYVEGDWQAAVGARTETEETMLSFAAATHDNSRLCCQIIVSDALDGLVVHTPDGQH